LTGWNRSIKPEEALSFKTLRKRSKSPSRKGKVKMENLLEKIEQATVRKIRQE